MSGEHKAISSIPAMLIPIKNSRPPTDAAETETTERKKQSFASSFDQLVASNLKLIDALNRFIRVSYWLLFALFFVTFATNILLLLRR